MPRKRIAAYKIGSRFSIEAARMMGVTRLLGRGVTRFYPRMGDIIFNWGCSRPPWEEESRPDYIILNKFPSVYLATNKRRTFERLTKDRVSCLEWTTSKDQASSWLSDGDRVYARVTLTGKGGQGIVILEPGSSVVPADLYTKGERKFKEFRVHCLPNETLVAQKRRRNSSDASFKIRNASNGFVFCVNKVDKYPTDLVSTSLGAISSLGLDFGAVDILLLPDGTPKVIEVNTAPLLEGTSLDKYLTMCSRFFEDEMNLSLGDEDEDEEDF
jgi:hypothetical protein